MYVYCVMIWNVIQMDNDAAQLKETDSQHANTKKLVLTSTGSTVSMPKNLKTTIDGQCLAMSRVSQVQSQDGKLEKTRKHPTEYRNESWKR